MEKLPLGRNPLLVAKEALLRLHAAVIEHPREDAMQQALVFRPIRLIANPFVQLLVRVSEPARQTYAALQKYHSTVLAAKAVTREQIEVAYLLGNAGLSKYLLAISVGSVFFGANTYIGNGPNFMVKAIADHQKVHTPTFLGYILKYALPYMAPMLVMVWLVFFRR